MKLFKVALAALIVLINLAVAQPSWADRPNLTTTPDYAEVTQALNSLLQAEGAPNQGDYTPEEIQQRIGELQLQKYILETAKDWAQCRNETGKTLAIYAHKAKRASQVPSLYYLGNGQETDDDWNCDGVYVPVGAKVAGFTPAGAQVQELVEPVALKVVAGTQLVAKTNPNGATEFNIAPAQVFKAGEGTWAIPNLSQADIDLQTPDAPIED